MQLESMERAITNAKERIKVELEELYQLAVEKLKVHHDARIYELETLKREERHRLEESAKANVKRAVEEGNKRLVCVLNERQSAWEAKEHSQNQKHISMMERQAAANKKHIESMNTGFQREVKMKLAEAEQGFADRQEITLKDFEKRMSEALSETDAQLRSEKEDELQRQRRSHNESIDKERSLFCEEKRQLEVNWDQKFNAAIDQEQRCYESKLSAALKDAARNAQEKIEDRVDEMKRDFESKKSHILADHKAELETSFVTNKETFLKLQSAAEREDSLRDQLKYASEIENQQREEVIKSEIVKWRKVCCYACSYIII